jgi:hypothetical protein
MGSEGDKIEIKVQFREFARVQLGGTWYRCSDEKFWRLHIKFKKFGAAPVWRDDGSSTAQDNADF